MSAVNTIKIAGPAGTGIKSGGQLLSQTLLHQQFHIFDYSEYPSLVRGGHNTFQVSFSSSPILAPFCHVNLFFSLKPGHWRQHLDEFTPDTLVFVDELVTEPDKARFLPLPLAQISQDVGSSLVSNIICLGVIAFIFDLNTKTCLSLIRQAYPKAADINKTAFKQGYVYAQKHWAAFRIKVSRPRPHSRHFYADGNTAFARGFIHGGGKFYAAYPMTPSTGALHELAQSQSRHQLAVFHPEDEIAAANMAAGAAFAGAPAAVGTSGGGFALMTEAVSFCGVAEIGVLFYLVSRPGPATGLPTWTGQSDLLFAINSGHGDFPKIVLAAGDQDESFRLAMTGLDLAARLQIPVILLSDKFLAESASNLPAPETIPTRIPAAKTTSSPSALFKRYSLTTATGVSTFTYPGTPRGEFIANSYEHDEFGFATEDARVASVMVDKRAKKLRRAIKLAPKANFTGKPRAKILIVSWGSTKGPILEALKLLPHPDQFAFLQLKTLWPIDPDIIKIIGKFKTVVTIENNQSGQMTSLLKSQFDFQPERQILKYDGRPFFPEELALELTQ